MSTIYEQIHRVKVEYGSGWVSRRESRYYNPHPPPYRPGRSGKGSEEKRRLKRMRLHLVRILKAYIAKKEL